MQQAGHRPRDPLVGLSQTGRRPRDPLGGVSGFCLRFVAVGASIGSVFIIRLDVVHILCFSLSFGSQVA